jgi:hypothetical protein
VRDKEKLNRKALHQTKLQDCPTRILGYVGSVCSIHRPVPFAPHPTPLPVYNLSSLLFYTYIRLLETTLYYHKNSFSPPTANHNTSSTMKLFAAFFTLLSLGTAAPAPAPAACTGTYCAVSSEPWSGVRKNVVVDCKTNGIVRCCAGVCVNSACV